MSGPAAQSKDQLSLRPWSEELGGLEGSGSLLLEDQRDWNAVHSKLLLVNSAHQLLQAEDFADLLSTRFSAGDRVL